MRAVIDTSSFVSLARAGQLQLLDRCRLDVVVLDVVWREAVDAGRAGGHADATAIESLLGGRAVTATPAGGSVDATVLQAAVEPGVLVTNDLALGRRARNLGVRWLRTADVVLLASRVGGVGAAEARAGLLALRDAGRLTPALTDAYLQELT